MFHIKSDNMLTIYYKKSIYVLFFQCILNFMCSTKINQLTQLTEFNLAYEA